MMNTNILRDYIRLELLNDSELHIADDDDLLLSGLLDSLNVVLLAGHIEEQCGFNIPPEDVIMEHFSTLNQINSYIQTRK